MKRIALAILLCISTLSCGASNFATSLKAVLAASGPLIESLNLGERKQAVVLGFTELAGDAGTLADALQSCTDKPCDLAAVRAFKSDYDRIASRGVFGVHPKLQKVGDILDGIITSAEIYYGAPNKGATRTAGGAAKPVTESDIKAQIKELQAAMK